MIVYLVSTCTSAGQMISFGVNSVLYKVCFWNGPDMSGTLSGRHISTGFCFSPAKHSKFCFPLSQHVTYRRYMYTSLALERQRFSSSPMK